MFSGLVWRLDGPELVRVWPEEEPCLVGLCSHSLWAPTSCSAVAAPFGITFDSYAALLPRLAETLAPNDDVFFLLGLVVAAAAPRLGDEAKACHTALGTSRIRRSTRTPIPRDAVSDEHVFSSTGDLQLATNSFRRCFPATAEAWRSVTVGALYHHVRLHVVAADRYTTGRPVVICDRRAGYSRGAGHLTARLSQYLAPVATSTIFWRAPVVHRRCSLWHNWGYCFVVCVTYCVWDGYL